MASLRGNVLAARAAVVGILSLALALGWARPAPAANAGFLILIENGLQFTSVADTDGLAVFFAHGTIRPIVNNQANFAQSLGSANVVVWSRAVPDPFFDPIGPIAALVTLTLEPPAAGAIAHLGVIQTPAGLRTTIGARQRVGFAYELIPGLRGQWVISNGIPAGGAATDLIIGGVAVLNTPIPLPPTSHELIKIFPTPPFFYDATPDDAHAVGTHLIGSFYGYTVEGQARPARAYTLVTSALPGFGFRSHMLVVQVGADEYQVMACSAANAVSEPGCTVSGVGTFNGALSGEPNGDYGVPDVSTFVLNLTPILVLP
jgi:hypothetical protein